MLPLPGPPSHKSSNVRYPSFFFFRFSFRYSNVDDGTVRDNVLLSVINLFPLFSF